MLSRIRVHLLTRVWCVVMAVHFFNLCADTPDLRPSNVPENLAYNDIESVVEMFLEQGLCLENAVPEYDDADEEQPENSRSGRTAAPFLLINPALPALPSALFTFSSKSLAPFEGALMPSATKDIPTPPPEMA